jgi:hypothetical protein
MSLTLISGGAPYALDNATPNGDDLWLTFADHAVVTGWEQKPQGLCRGEQCVPIPPARRSEFIAPEEDAVNAATFARYLGGAVVHDDDARVWLIRESPAERHVLRHGDPAPDFTLPDLDGTLHSLADERGKKVLLLGWASW